MNSDRPTLEEQIAVSKMTDQELRDLLTCRHDFWRRLDLFIFCHSELFWHIIHWNWFCIYCSK